MGAAEEAARSTLRYGKMRYSRPVEEGDGIIAFSDAEGFARWCDDLKQLGLFTAADEIAGSARRCRFAATRAVSDGLWELTRCMVKERTWLRLDSMFAVWMCISGFGEAAMIVFCLSQKPGNLLSTALAAGGVLLFFGVAAVPVCCNQRRACWSRQRAALCDRINSSPSVALGLESIPAGPHETAELACDRHDAEPASRSDPFGGIDILDRCTAALADGIGRKVARIRAWVAEHPQSAGSVRKLESVYLPQAARFLRAYADLEHTGSVGSDACESLRAALTRFDTALDAMYASLVSAEAMDAVADAYVLTKILSQDGYDPCCLSDGGDGE